MTDYQIIFDNSMDITHMCQYCRNVQKIQQKNFKISVECGNLKFTVICPKCGVYLELRNSLFKTKVFYCECTNYVNITCGLNDVGYSITCKKCGKQYGVETI